MIERRKVTGEREPWGREAMRRDGEWAGGRGEEGGMRRSVMGSSRAGWPSFHASLIPSSAPLGRVTREWSGEARMPKGLDVV